jgi:Zn-dependent protease with chaperone function
MKFEPRYVEGNVNVSTRHQGREFLRLGAWLLGIVFGTYLVLGFIAERIAERLPPQMEQALAAGFVAQLNKKDFFQTRVYLQTVLDRLALANSDLPPFQYTVYVVDDDLVNAVALPAGNILIFRGLLAKIKTESELAMVLAHELGHYAHRDHLRGLGRGLVVMTISGVLGMAGEVPGFIFPSIRAFELKFSRDQESVADNFGLDLVAKVYGNTGGALSVFDTLESGTEGPKGVEFFSTHPDTIWRKQLLAERIRLKQYPQKPPVPLSPPGSLPFPGDGPVSEEKG